MELLDHKDHRDRKENVGFREWEGPVGLKDQWDLWDQRDNQGGLTFVDKPMLGGGGPLVLRIKELNWCIQGELEGAGGVRLVELPTISVCPMTLTTFGLILVFRDTTTSMGWSMNQHLGNHYGYSLMFMLTTYHVQCAWRLDVLCS
ncbi:hypothetical protein GBAR_LOCUS15318 [Geodia barretti]|uniref:Uncharacterized protein n=1 Tax=Geodia barretti TaxID=519541 RepID=A0AA35SB21_GEOBA|nr:hypothetical protein GBAR_LOCUS15318 [Geodia barretti]